MRTMKPTTKARHLARRCEKKYDTAGEWSARVERRRSGLGPANAPVATRARPESLEQAKDDAHSAALDAIDAITSSEPDWPADAACQRPWSS